MDTTILDLDSVLDGNLNNVKDIPDYLNPPTGSYILSISKAEFKVVETKDKETGAKGKVGRISMTYKVEETLEIADPKELAVANETCFVESFTYTEQGLEYFKKQAKKILNVESLDEVSLREILSSLEEVAPFKARIKTEETTVDSGKTYTNTRVTPIHAE